jgi:hypothetical protein
MPRCITLFLGRAADSKRLIAHTERRCCSAGILPAKIFEQASSLRHKSCLSAPASGT